MAEARTTFAKIKRVDEKKHLVSAEVYAPYQTDTYGDFMLPDDIEVLAHRTMRLDLSKIIDVNHNETPIEAYPVEAFVARDSDPDFTPGAFVMTVKIEDKAAWAAVLRGDLNGFSFQAMVKAIDVDVEIDVLRDHVGMTEPAEDGHSHLFFVQLDEKGVVKKGWTDVVDGHSHEISYGTVTMPVDGHSHRYFFGD